MITLRQLKALRIMLDCEEEMVVDGLMVWVGDEQFSCKTSSALLGYLAIKDVSDLEGKGMRRYVINDVGESILRRPELADEVREHVLLSKGNFTITDDRIVLI